MFIEKLSDDDFLELKMTLSNTEFNYWTEDTEFIPVIGYTTFKYDGKEPIKGLELFDETYLLIVSYNDSTEAKKQPLILAYNDLNFNGMYITFEQFEALKVKTPTIFESETGWEIR